MSFTLLGILNAQAAGGGVPYFFSLLGTADYDLPGGIATDSDGNIYSSGLTPGSIGGNDAFISKQDPAGTLQWQKFLGSADSDRYSSVHVDSSNNVYAIGSTDIAFGSAALLVKYNTAGTLQWQRTLSTASTYSSGVSVTTDSSGNVYYFGQTNIGGARFLIVKYNSSGALQWQRTLNGASTEAGTSITIDSAGNVYAVGYTDSIGPGSVSTVVFKYNSSGTLQWQRVIGTTLNEFVTNIAIDSSNNVYFTGRTAEGFGSNQIFTIKYNSSGTLQWQRFLGQGQNEDGRGIAVDSSGNIYTFAIMQNTGASYLEMMWAKYDSSGVIQLQRQIRGSSNDYAVSITIDSQDNLCLLGRTYTSGSGGQDFFIGKVPSDGSLTGTYVLDAANYIYSASTLTDSAGTMTDAAGSLTSATSTLTNATSTLTEATATLTQYLVTL
jgi:uncharacterized delta-60 repeat protein